MTPDPAPDLSLVQGLHAARKDAFERLYAQHHPAIYNLCARILGDREEARDVTQETFITAFANPPAADSALRLRPWLYRVATNACFNQLRSRKRNGGGGELVEDIAAPVDEFARAETVAAVEQSLGQLNERYRAALVLKDLHGLPADEIADVLEVSRPTADVLVHRARAAFKAAFAKVGGDMSAPANLGLVLAPLAVPAALQVMPPLPHAAVPVPPHPLPSHPVPPSVAPVGAAPHASGLLGKLATATAAKLAIGAAAAVTLIGGGALAVRGVEHSRSHGSSANAQTPPATFTTSTSTSCQRHHSHEKDHEAILAEHQDATHGDHTADHMGDEAAAGTSGHTSDHSGVTTHSSDDGGTATHDGGAATTTGTSDHSMITTDGHDGSDSTSRDAGDASGDG
jgi:RNA polymerase sigma-70 factor, ECF subfamily